MGRQATPHTIIDHLPTHDATPAVTIYKVSTPTSTQTASIIPPLFSYQFYSTVAPTASKAHAMSVAVQIHEGTLPRRLRNDQFPQRIDVYSFPLPDTMSMVEKGEKCIEHQKAEIEARMRSGKRDFFMQGTFSKEDHQRVFFMLDSEVEKLEEKGYVMVEFDLKVKNEERDEDDQLDEVYIRRFKDVSKSFQEPEVAKEWTKGRPPVMEALGSVLGRLEDKAQSFYETYVHEGVIDRDLRNASGH